MRQEWKIFFLLFDHVEVLDFSGSFDVFSMANVAIPLKKGEKEDYDQGRVFKLYTVSESGGTVKALHGLKIEADFSFDSCPVDDIDVLIIPGASPDIIKKFIAANPEVIEWVRQRCRHVEIVASVCVGALILAEAGGFDGLRCTTHHGAIADLGAVFERRKAKAEIVRGARYVDNEESKSPRVLSSAGVSAGIDQAFYMLRSILGNETLARTTAVVMEYNESANWDYGKFVPVPWPPA